MAKTLIAYFSHAGQNYSHGSIRNLPVGNTEVVAKKLHALIDSDLFFINVLGELLAYQVDQVNVVLPHELEYMAAVEGEDLVTLVTCTPYGVNTHRLLVRGHRTGDLVKEETGGAAGGGSDAGRSFDRYIPYIAGAAVVIFVFLYFLPGKKKQ